jgi:hypothetical protein
MKHREILDSLEQGLNSILDARSDSRYIQGIEGIVIFEELDRLALLTKLAIEKIAAMDRSEGVRNVFNSKDQI